jgi:hypothetical protein
MKGYSISVIVLSLFQLKTMKEVTKKVAHGGKKSQKKSCQHPPFSSRTAIIFCFDLQSCVKARLYKLGSKYVTALLTVTETWLKDSR